MTLGDRPRSGSRQDSSTGGLRVGQVVATQVAALVAVAAATQGVVGIVVGAVVAVLLLALTWAPVRKRWLFEWAGVGLRYATRRKALPAGAPPAAFAELVCPGTTTVAAELAGENAAMISDGYGLTAVLEVGDRAGLLGEQAQNLPPLATLLPPANPENPPIRLQLLLTAAPAPVLATGNGPAGTSYRQLTDGRLLAQARVLLAVRVSRTEGWSTEDLRRALSSAVRKVRRRLDETPAQLLGDAAATRVLAELALHGESEPVQESWQALRVGGQAQAVFRLRRWPGSEAGQDARLVARFLALPATTTTVAISAGPWGTGRDEMLPVGMTVRLAAPAAAELNLAAQALRQAAKAEGTEVRRIDGEQLDGLAATLPLGGGGQNLTLAAADVNRLALPLGLTGLMVGRNRQGAPMTLRLFRPEPTRMTLVGGVRAAQLMALRAMALGARVLVQTYRPHAWEPFIRGATMPGQVIPMVPPGRQLGEVDGTSWQPTLIVSDCGPAENNQGPVGPGTGPGWQATLVVREQLTHADTDGLSRADVVLLQPLRADEASLAGAALGLGEAAEWLTRMRPDMVAVVNRRTLRWAMLTITPIETQLVGAPTRPAPTVTGRASAGTVYRPAVQA